MPEVIPPPGASYSSETGIPPRGNQTEFAAGGGSTRTNQGNSWFQAGLPTVVEGDAGKLIVVQGVAGTTRWKPDGSGGYVPEFGSYMQFRHDTAKREFVLTSTDGSQKFFHDFDSSISATLRGQLKAMWNSARMAPVIARDADNQITSIGYARAGRGSAIEYTYYGEGDLVGLIKSVTNLVNGIPQNRESYLYYGDGETGGSLADLKRATGEEFDGTVWQVTGEDWKCPLSR